MIRTIYIKIKIKKLQFFKNEKNIFILCFSNIEDFEQHSILEQNTHVLAYFSIGLIFGGHNRFSKFVVR
jgi:hypothetical protein